MLCRLLYHTYHDGSLTVRTWVVLINVIQCRYEQAVGLIYTSVCCIISKQTQQRHFHPSRGVKVCIVYDNAESECCVRVFRPRQLNLTVLKLPKSLNCFSSDTLKETRAWIYKLSSQSLFHIYRIHINSWWPINCVVIGERSPWLTLVGYYNQRQKKHKIMFHVGVDGPLKLLFITFCANVRFHVLGLLSSRFRTWGSRQRLKAGGGM